ncbi:hypothetical protein QBC32DRAFT_316863 [Pseudoneurospora amorphoporcata]|uniref:Uncharacterized protein n=1 Tax=Pseudoneurospora amorphoporcata TaxID=241081 RepID=A0AAN6NQZ0_9PEZI|nr:hypothetical protein QBC32DRAFT_316863 [Pseudoneurospora amorphoporcata]
MDRNKGKEVDSGDRDMDVDMDVDRGDRDMDVDMNMDVDRDSDTRQGFVGNPPQSDGDRVDLRSRIERRREIQAAGWRLVKHEKDEKDKNRNEQQQQPKTTKKERRPRVTCIRTRTSNSSSEPGGEEGEGKQEIVTFRCVPRAVLWDLPRTGKGQTREDGEDDEVDDEMDEAETGSGSEEEEIKDEIVVRL